MVNIYIGDMPEAIYNTSVYFKNKYLDEWMEDELVRKMISSVDKGQVMGPGLIITKALGPIPPEKLSGGVKALILMYKEPEHIFNASNCGDNCARWILEIGKRQDITINLRHIMNFGKRKLSVRVLNDPSGTILTSMDDFAEVAVRYL